MCLISKDLYKLLEQKWVVERLSQLSDHALIIFKMSFVLKIPKFNNDKLENKVTKSIEYRERFVYSKQNKSIMSRTY